MMDASEIIVKKCGVRFQPPCLVIFYETGSTKQLRRRIMPLYQFDEESDVKAVMEQLKRKHHNYLISLPSAKLEKFGKIIQANMKGISITSDLSGHHKEQYNYVDDVHESATFETAEDAKQVIDKINESTYPTIENRTIETSGWDSDSEEPFF